MSEWAWSDAMLGIAWLEWSASAHGLPTLLSDAALLCNACYCYADRVSVALRQSLRVKKTESLVFVARRR